MLVPFLFGIALVESPVNFYLHRRERRIIANFAAF